MKIRKKTFMGIQSKLLISFLVPVCLIILLGVISYKKSADGFKKNYEEAALANISTICDYYELGFHTISSKSLQLDSMEVITNYYSGVYKNDDVQQLLQYNECYNQVYSAAVLDSMISNVYIISKDGDNIMSFSNNDILGNIYEEFLNSKECKAFTESRNPEIWLGYHDFIDERVGDKAKDYSISIMRNLMNSGDKKCGYVIYDINYPFIEDILKDVDLSDGSFIGFITVDGKEILSGDYKEGFSFTDTDFYQETITSDVLKSCKYVDYNNKKYLFSYSKIDGYNSEICYMIPEKVILSQSNDLKNMTIIIVIATSLIAFIIGTIISMGIVKTIKKINIGLFNAAQGDLNIKLRIRRKDEFNKLTNGIMNMIGNMKGLIKQIIGVSTEVSKASLEVAKNSSIVLTSTQGMTQDIQKIEKDVVQQSQDSEMCLSKMSELSDRINSVSENANKIRNSTKMTRDIIKSGKVVLEDLNNKVQDTTNIMKNIMNNIVILSDLSKNIEGITNTINYIAEETNLLSLNASIEAAKVGDYGKGFAVVANEIGSLATQTGKSAMEIAKIISNIQEHTSMTVDTVEKAKEIVLLQEKSLGSTINVFDNMNKYIEDLVDNLKFITEGISDIENVKVDTLDAIKNISYASEEVAITMTNLTKTSGHQLGAIETLNNIASELKENVSHLENSIKVFKID